MWKDDNGKIEELYKEIKKIKIFPTICPVCKKKDAHIYIHVYNGKTRRGGVWVWCSDCHTFFHGSTVVPDYWDNCTRVEVEKLCAIPNYLDELKEIIDAHVNTMLVNQM